MFLLSSLVGCDEAYDAADAADDPITHRCPTSDCTGGPLNNTSRLGDHALSNLSQTLGQAVNNGTASVQIDGGTDTLAGVPTPILALEVEDDGELRLQLGNGSTAPTWIGGAAVAGATLDLTITPTTLGQPAFTGSLKIVDAACDPGEVDPTLTICRYVFITDVVPDDTVKYPEHSRFPGWYHTCPDEDEDGVLDAALKFSAVLSPNVTLGANASGPTIDVDAGKFINGCLNGAVSKSQYFLNAFYDATAYRGLDASQRTAILRMWMAWHDGASQTVPGQRISPHDPINGLFTWTSASGWDVEAGYDAVGASCRGGGTNGLHRNVVAPVLNLLGWSALPQCNATNVGSYASIGVKVEI